MRHVSETAIGRRDRLTGRPGAIGEGGAAPFVLIRAGLPPSKGQAPAGRPLLGKRVSAAVARLGLPAEIAARVPGDHLGAPPFGPLPGTEGVTGRGVTRPHILLVASMRPP